MTSCKDKAPVVAAPPVESSDLDGLEKLVRLPSRPLSGHWKKEIQGSPGLGPTDYSVTAVLTYGEAEARAFLSSAKVQERAKATLSDKSWLASHLPEMQPLSESPDKVKAYDAAAFYKAPLQAGTLFHVLGTSKYVLILYTL